MRKHRKRIATLLVVVGLLLIVIAGLFALTALFRYEYEQARFFRFALYYLAGGGALLVLHYLIFTLPETISDLRSETARRRREHFKSFQRPPSAPPARRRDEGGILVVALVLLGVVSLAAGHALVTARAAQAEAGHAWRMQALQLAALDSARAAMQQLADDPDGAVDHAGKPWAGFYEEIDAAGISRLVRVTDLHRTFDLNNLAVPATGDQVKPAEALAMIMVGCGIFTPGRLVEALRDWVDADAAGAFETPHYQRQASGHNAANRVLYGWSDLMLVDGWSADLFERKPYRSRSQAFAADLVDSVTIIPAPRDRVIPLNINTMEPAVLQSLLGLGREAAAERILTQRKQAPYRNTGFLIDVIGRDAFNRISPYLDVRSSYFHIETSAHQDGVSARLQVIAHRSEPGRVQAISALF
ncbi:MAG TPA: type II secretion system protein GspK [Kiritimatiellia bacterium]|nr:type II secretion system protein GspK [Kiritimatiellia bacterium]HMO99555.1 type II secretion system protein GspK [Kiritimatiellia bacterium]HMP97451.1 type II secretion system protein GspK [Kiritimatiellia bacterium]